MKKIIPFKKDIIFKTNIAEITSISLENTLTKSNDNSVTGEFIVSGDYKVADDSIHIEPFTYNLPFDIHMDDKYILDNSVIDIDDFYYEIINSNVLSINIEVLIDKLEEKLFMEEKREEKLPMEEKIEEIGTKVEDKVEEDRKISLEDVNQDTIDDIPRCIEEEDEVIETKSKEVTTLPNEITSLFDNLDDSKETYQSYKVYIVREGDDLELIMEKYATSREVLEQYNDLKEIKLGDKIIIPYMNENA